MTLAYRHGRPNSKPRLRRLGLAAALFALLCQIVIPVGHDGLELLAGVRCPGLDLPVTGDSRGTAAGAPASRPSQDHGQACPTFQSFVYLAPLGSAGPPPLPAPVWTALHYFPANRLGLVPAGYLFSRPFPRAPPARA